MTCSLRCSCGFNPQLELTFKPTKAIASIASRLGDKWGGKLSALRAERAAKPAASQPAPEFRLYPNREGESQHPGWGTGHKSVQARHVHSFMGNPSRFVLFYALDEPLQAITSKHSARADHELEQPPPCSLKRARLPSTLEPDTSSSSNDFVPFQRHLARIDAFQPDDSSSPADHGGERAAMVDEIRGGREEREGREGWNKKESPVKQVPGNVDFSEVAKGQSKMAPSWTGQGLSPPILQCRPHPPFFLGRGGGDGTCEWDGRDGESRR